MHDLPQHRSETPQSAVLCVFLSPLFEKNRSDISFFPSIGEFT